MKNLNFNKEKTNSWPNIIVTLIGISILGALLFVILLLFSKTNPKNGHICNNEYCNMFLDTKFDGCHKCVEHSYCRYVDSLHWHNPKMPINDFKALVANYAIPIHKITYSEDNLAEAMWVTNRVTYIPSKEILITDRLDIKNIALNINTHTRYLGMEKGCYIFFASPMAVDSIQNFD